MMAFDSSANQSKSRAFLCCFLSVILSLSLVLCPVKQEKAEAIAPALLPVGTILSTSSVPVAVEGICTFAGMLGAYIGVNYVFDELDEPIGVDETSNILLSGFVTAMYNGWLEKYGQSVASWLNGLFTSEMNACLETGTLNTNTLNVILPYTVDWAGDYIDSLPAYGSAVSGSSANVIDLGGNFLASATVLKDPVYQSVALQELCESYINDGYNPIAQVSYTYHDNSVAGSSKPTYYVSSIIVDNCERRLLAREYTNSKGTYMSLDVSTAEDDLSEIYSPTVLSHWINAETGETKYCKAMTFTEIWTEGGATNYVDSDTLDFSLIDGSAFTFQIWNATTRTYDTVYSQDAVAWQEEKDSHITTFPSLLYNPKDIGGITGDTVTVDDTLEQVLSTGHIGIISTGLGVESDTLTHANVLDNTGANVLTDEYAGTLESANVIALSGTATVALSSTATIESGNIPEGWTFSNLSDKFPFCIPFDLIDLITGLQANVVAPSFTFTFPVPAILGGGVIDFGTFDFDDFQLPIEVLRWGMKIIFVAGLIVVTRNLIKG